MTVADETAWAGVYERLLTDGSVVRWRELMPRKGPLLSPKEEACWRMEEAEPFWSALVALAVRDNLSVYCYQGVRREQLYDGVGAAVCLLDPLTSEKLSDRRLDLTAFERRLYPRMVDAWRARAAVPPPLAPPERVEADYRQLLVDGMVSGCPFQASEDLSRDGYTLYLSDPDVTQPTDSRPRRRDPSMWDRVEMWTVSTARPWWAALTLRARADGRLLHCFTNYVYPTEEQLFGNSIFVLGVEARAVLLDPASRTELHRTRAATSALSASSPPTS